MTLQESQHNLAYVSEICQEWDLTPRLTRVNIRVTSWTRRETREIDGKSTNTTLFISKLTSALSFMTTAVRIDMQKVSWVSGETDEFVRNRIFETTFIVVCNLQQTKPCKVRFAKQVTWNAFVSNIKCIRSLSCLSILEWPFWSLSQNRLCLCTLLAFLAFLHLCHSGFLCLLMTSRAWKAVKDCQGSCEKTSVDCSLKLFKFLRDFLFSSFFLTTTTCVSIICVDDGLSAARTRSRSMLPWL